MQTTTGDIWQVATKKDVVIVPVNCGWTTEGKAVMGKGLARDAARRWPHLVPWYGTHCMDTWDAWGNVAPLLVDTATSGNTHWCRGLVLFPTKPLNREKPYLSWRQSADLDLIERGLKDLVQIQRLQIPWVKEALFLVPLLGCGEGGLQEEAVVPLITRHLQDDHFVLVKKPAEKFEEKP